MESELNLLKDPSYKLNGTSHKVGGLEDDFPTGFYMVLPCFGTPYKFHIQVAKQNVPFHTWIFLMSDSSLERVLRRQLSSGALCKFRPIPRLSGVFQVSLRKLMCDWYWGQTFTSTSAMTPTHPWYFMSTSEPTDWTIQHFNRRRNDPHTHTWSHMYMSNGTNRVPTQLAEGRVAPLQIELQRREQSYATPADDQRFVRAFFGQHRKWEAQTIRKLKQSNAKIGVGSLIFWVFFHQD